MSAPVGREGRYVVTPDTVHLAAQVIRHQRGIMTAIEKWIAKQPPSPANLELFSVTLLQRQILDAFESRLSQVETTEPVV